MPNRVPAPLAAPDDDLEPEGRHFPDDLPDTGLPADTAPQSAATRASNPFAGLSLAEQKAKLVAQLEECKPHDEALKLFKRCIGGLEKSGLPRAAIHALLQNMTDAYAAGIEFPPLGNAMLVEADSLGVPRDVLVHAAKVTRYAKRGADPKKNMRDRLDDTRKQLRAMNDAAQIPADELLGMADLHELATAIVKERRHQRRTSKSGA